MATFRQYTKKNGQKAWMFNAYGGYRNGKQINITRRGFATRKEARIALSRLDLGIEENKKSENEETYEDIYHLWYEEYKSTVKESTLLKTERIFKNHILPAFGKKNIINIKPLDVQAQMNIWHKKLVRASMIMNYAGLIFDYAIRMQLITLNPTKVIKKTARAKQVKDDDHANFYDKPQLKQFMQVLESGENFRAYVFFRLLAFTGIRKGEILALNWADIDFKNKTLFINKAVARSEKGLYIDTPKTTSSIRRISLDDITLDLLSKFKKDAPKGLIFQNEHGGILSPAKPRKWYLSAMQKLPDNFKWISIHGFRHTHMHRSYLRLAHRSKTCKQGSGTQISRRRWTCTRMYQKPQKKT